MVVFACNSKDDMGATDEEVVFPAYVWPEGKKYYYGFDEKIYLDEVPNKVVISFDEKCLSEIEQYLRGNEQILNMEFQMDRYFCICILTTVLNADTEGLMTNLKKQAWAKSVNPIYVASGVELIVTEKIMMQLLNRNTLNAMSKKYGFEIKKDTGLYQLISVPVDVDPLEAANTFQESGMVVYCHPSFVAKITSWP